VPHLHREQTIPLPIEEAFRFFEDPQNLKLITPEHLHLVVTNEGGIQMRRGAEITYTIRWMGLPLSWRTLITEYDPPHSFKDIQLRGPYRKWEHTHTLIAEGDHTRMRDDVEYELPFGSLGQLVAGWLVRQQLETIFDFRRQKIETLLQRNN
jgi:ligand-binding SRPBCC domain-containing protein